MKNRKKLAFTLIELLVVVIVLGVLAGVAVPKFKRVLETRKITEAENMLAAVRTEQEKRCIMGKKYQTDASKVEVLANATKSPNYDYSVTSSGAKAASKTGGYSLEMLSYKDGSFCCSGSGCSKINKNYAACGSIVRDECSNDVACSGSAPASERTVSRNDGTCRESQDVTCDRDYGSYVGAGNWTTIAGSCQCTSAETSQTNTSDGVTCRRSRTSSCNKNTAELTLGDWSAWSGNSKSGTNKSGRCSTPYTKACNSSTGEVETTYGTKTCTCEGQVGNQTTQNDTESISHGSCPKSRTCNTGTGNWGSWTIDYGKCTCDEGYTWNSTSKVCEEKEKTCEQNPNQEKCCPLPAYGERQGYLCDVRKIVYWDAIHSKCETKICQDNLVYIPCPTVECQTTAASCQSSSEYEKHCGGGGNSGGVYQTSSKTITSTIYIDCGYPDSSAHAGDLAYQAGFRNDRCYNLSAGEACKSGYPSCWSHISCGSTNGSSRQYTVSGLVCSSSSGGGGFPMGSH